MFIRSTTRSAYLESAERVSTHAHGIPRLWTDTLVYPSVVALTSLAILLLQLVFRSGPVQHLYAKLARSDACPKVGEDVESNGSGGQVTSHVAELGGPVIFAFKLLRFFSCLALLALSVAEIVLRDEDVEGVESSMGSRWVVVGLTAAYVCRFCSSPLSRAGLTRPTSGICVPFGVRIRRSASQPQQARDETPRTRPSCVLVYICVPRPLASGDVHSPASGRFRWASALGQNRCSHPCGRLGPSAHAAPIYSRRPKGMNAPIVT